MRILILFTTILLWTSCSVLKQSGQGVQGQITWLEGNQLSQITEEGEAKSYPSGQPVQRTLVVHPLTNLEDAKLENGLFQSLATQPILEIQSDSEGKFAVPLAPGDYSIFTKEDQGMYANRFDAAGNIQPLRIEKGEWQKLDIVIDYKAYD